jgi:hypothetical protein
MSYHQIKCKRWKRLGVASRSRFNLYRQIIITIPGVRSLSRALRALPEGNFSWVYLGQSIVEFNQASECFHHRGTYLNTTPQFHQTAESLRESYLAYLFNLGENLNSLRWWITSLSYRSAFASKTFHRTCYLKVALDLVATRESQEPLVLVIDQQVGEALQMELGNGAEMKVQLLGSRRIPFLPALRDTAKMLAHRMFFTLAESRRMLQARWMVPNPYQPNKNVTLLLSWATPENLRHGAEFHESYFGDLAAKLGELGHKVAIVPMTLMSVDYKEALAKWRESSQPFLIPNRTLTFADLIQTVLSSCAKPPQPKSIPHLAGMDISPLIQDDLRSHWISNQAPVALLIVALVRRWATLAHPIDRLIYTYENQPWERALCWEARRSLPQSALAGYLHARAPRLLLNWYLAPGEEKKAPLPDRVITVGELTARMLSNSGYTLNQVRVGGALQMQSLLASQSEKNPSPTNTKCGPILIASSNGLEETAELADIGSRLFDTEEGSEVILKCHPSMPFDNVKGLLGIPLPKYVRVSDEPIADLMLKSSLVIYSGSTVCIQALALGIPVIHLRPHFDLDLDPLEEFPNSRLEATGLEEMRQQVRWLLDNREEYIAQHREEWERIVADMYSPVTSDTFRAFID